MPQLHGRARLKPAVPARGRTVHWLAVLLFALPALLLPAAASAQATPDGTAPAALGQQSSTPTAASDRPSQATYLQAETAVAVPVTRSARAQHLRDSRWWPVFPVAGSTDLTRPGDGYAEGTSARGARPNSASTSTAAPRGPPASGALAL